MRRGLSASSESMALRVDIDRAVEHWLSPFEHRTWNAKEIYARGKCMMFPKPGFEHAHQRKHGKFDNIRNHIEHCSGIRHFLIYGEEHVNRRQETCHNPPTPVLCTGLYKGTAIPIPWVCWTNPEFRPESKTNTSWRERKDRAVFRGGCWTRERHELVCARYQGVDAQWVLPTDRKRRSKRIWKSWEQKRIDGIPRKVTPVGEWMSPEDQANHRYVIDQWGTEALTWKMASGCTVIRLLPKSEFWFEPFLEEGVHYVYSTVEDLPKTLTKLRQNESWAEGMAIAAKDAAMELFQPEFIACFTRKLMARYAELVPAP